MHSLLKRQLKKSGLVEGKINKKKFIDFCTLINQAYIDTDKDRMLQENILNTSSQEMRQLYEDVREISEKDQLTGILNKYSFENTLKSVLLKPEVREKGLALCIFDVDYFKNINDTLGHDVGDRLLKSVTRKINRLLEPDDLFARIGGDEFIIVYNGIKTEKEVIPKLDQLMELFRSSWSLNEYELELSSSIGVCLFPRDEETIYGLMKKADIAMYRAKSEGRDNYIFYSKTLNQERQYLEQSMPTALKNSEFELHYQPIVNSRSNKIQGAESLLRWQHPTRGLIYPGDFINLAEKSGFILKLGKWVIEESCKFLAQISENNKEFILSVNVSMKQFQHGDIYQVIEKSISKTGVNPNQLAIEITESIMQNNIEDVINKINKIKSLGVKIYIDDFGTGYSSLSFLNKLDVDVIKIDKSFVDQIDKEKSPVIVLNTIISMGSSLRKRMIAEGVENNYQVDYLLENGCSVYQGYLFSKPVPESDLVKLLNS